jgi:DNA (cytosine-5)-methyltransferase 1
MIEFYFTNFKKSYKTKVIQLIKDLERLLDLEGFTVWKSDNNYLCCDFRAGLTNDLWFRLNDLYFTLDVEKNKISKTLKNFLIKTGDNILPKHRFIDTFAGCGGLSKGLSNAGFNPVLVNEIESKFLETYYFNHNLTLDSYFCGDIKELVQGELLDDEQFQDLDLVVGGPPCQGFSMANRQRILDDPRNDLYKQFLKLLGRTRPKFFLMENVRGMMNKVDEIIDNFKTVLGYDYSIKMILLNARNYGVPQNRERVFVIGTRVKGVDMDELVNRIVKHEPDTVDYVLKDALAGLPKLYPKTERNKGGLENERIGFKFRKGVDEENGFLSFIGGKSEYLSNHTNRFNNKRDVEIFSRLPQGANSLHPSIADIMPYSNRNHMFKDKYFKLNEREVSKTITSHMKFDCNMYIHPFESRGISPREAARIQTFPDDYVFMGANNIWYAQIGNAVPVKLAQAIGEEIMKYLN